MRRRRGEGRRTEGYEKKKRGGGRLCPLKPAVWMSSNGGVSGSEDARGTNEKKTGNKCWDVAWSAEGLGGSSNQGTLKLLKYHGTVVFRGLRGPPIVPRAANLSDGLSIFFPV